MYKSSGKPAGVILTKINGIIIPIDMRNFQFDKKLKILLNFSKRKFL